MITTNRSLASIRGAAKHYGSRAILKDVTVEFAAGSTYVIRGPSGSGKTTILNLLAGYTQCDAGRVEAPGRVCYVLQEEALFSTLDVRENLMIRFAGLDVPPVLFDGMITASLERLDVAHLIRHPVSHLSGGERQRVQLAGAFASMPDLLLLDEPTSSLDPANRRDVVRAIDDVFAGTTVVIVSHDPRLSEEFIDAIDLLIVDGRLEHG